MRAVRGSRGNWSLDEILKFVDIDSVLMHIWLNGHLLKSFVEHGQGGCLSTFQGRGKRSPDIGHLEVGFRKRLRCKRQHSKKGVAGAGCISHVDRRWSGTHQLGSQERSTALLPELYYYV